MGYYCGNRNTRRVKSRRHGCIMSLGTWRMRVFVCESEVGKVFNKK